MKSSTAFLLLGIVASFNSFATGIISPQKPDISWQQKDNENHCIGNTCFKIQENQPNKFDRLSKTERREIMDPNSHFDHDNSENRRSLTLHFHHN
ncbi:hypothetical protein [Serratia aquatilis]|uniref:Uncharacterized protein n=1 Tax=Serratia aquatilis TaxID=1737515 RepID=A0ABV6EH66_9GAMM